MSRTGARTKLSLVGLLVLALVGAGQLHSAPPVLALPPAGTDVLDVSGEVSLTSLLGSETIPLSGTVTIQRSDPQIQGGVEVVDPEIVAMDLAGTSLTGPITVTESAILVSSGELQSQQPPPNQFPASSFFDVFLVVVAPASPSPTITLHIEVPLHLVPTSGRSEVPLNAGRRRA